jgi:nucleoside-diphosphate-sugar epimerase
MKSLSKTDRGILITGSSGFVGVHLCDEVARLDRVPVETREASLLDRAGLDKLAEGWRVDTVIHLAGRGVVVAPVALAPAMYSTAIDGTLNVLQAFSPGTALIASTCAVYGETGDRPAVAGETPTHPLGLYGISRTATELLATTWAAETGNTALLLRFGNVIGPNCRGLIPYLVDHAVRYPDASEPARLRGGGKIIRDYVPVSHIVNVLAKAALHPRNGTTPSVFNVATGRGRANGDIAEFVTRMMAERGYRLRIEYSRDPAPCEARQVLLDVAPTTEAFGIKPPSEDAILGAIADSVFYRLGQLTGGDKVAVRL